MKGMKFIWIILAGVFCVSQTVLALENIAPPDYPDELTQRGWRKNKGIIAKIVKKNTGIGDLLGDCEQKYRDIDWRRLQATDRTLALVVRKGKDGAEEAEEDARRYHGDKVEDLQRALMSLRSRAAELADEWKRSKSIPKGSRKYVERIAHTAEDFHGDLMWNNMREYRASFDRLYTDYIEGFKGAIESGYKSMKSGITTVKEAGENAKSLQATVFLQPYRAFWAASLRIPELKSKYQDDVDTFGKQVKDWTNSSIEGEALVSACEEAMRTSHEAYRDYKSLK